MKFLIIVSLLLTLSVSKSYAVDCETARQYAKTYTKAQLAAMAKAAGIVVTKEQRAEYAQCFRHGHKRKH